MAILENLKTIEREKRNLAKTIFLNHGFIFGILNNPFRQDTRVKETFVSAMKVASYSFGENPLYVVSDDETQKKITYQDGRFIVPKDHALAYIRNIYASIGSYMFDVIHDDKDDRTFYRSIETKDGLSEIVHSSAKLYRDEIARCLKDLFYSFANINFSNQQSLLNNRDYCHNILLLLKIKDEQNDVPQVPEGLAYSLKYINTVKLSLKENNEDNRSPYLKESDFIGDE